MIGLLILGIGFLASGFCHLRQYLLFKTGIDTKGIITDVKYERSGIKLRSDFAKITYSYEISGNKYLKTEKSEKAKHLFKMHSMINEPIQIKVQKDSNEKVTIAYRSFLKSSIFLLVLGILSIFVGIISNLE